MEEYRDSMRNIKRVFSKPQKYNEVENGLSPIILTRKDMLFCENQEAVKNTAVICSLLGSCKGCGVNSCEWLNYVNTKLAILPRTQIEQESTGIASSKGLRDDVYCIKIKQGIFPAMLFPICLEANPYIFQLMLLTGIMSPY